MINIFLKKGALRIIKHLTFFIDPKLTIDSHQTSIGEEASASREFSNSIYFQLFLGLWKEVKMAFQPLLPRPVSTRESCFELFHGYGLL